MKIYEYAVIRFVPDIEREEFVNIGLLMMCKKQRWIGCYLNPSLSKMVSMSPDIEISVLEQHLRLFHGICNGDHEYGALSELPVEERFRWLTAVKSACIQTSRPHPGVTDDIDKTFLSLSRRLVD